MATIDDTLFGPCVESWFTGKCACKKKKKKRGY